MAAKTKVYACKLEELAVGSSRIIEAAGKSIGIFHTGGEIVAVLNLCPHEFAPVCRGSFGGTTLPSAPGEFKWGREHEILRCPWHGWEFDLLTGACLTDRRRLRRFPVTIRDGAVYVEV